ncbi:helix-turn-helix domain-containing protein [Streptomyces arenae]|uniref:helix-turn-helix domain-containing protein n=1 Tax=Streptomyces arenae TaxID=29301 RepID=UPI00265A955A|nr:helix-turn-helix domain-containing protein [Streptomyces arenae]MCG7210783.1 helix-turn-helix domain-containing protein [Streptomyces arenae]
MAENKPIPAPRPNDGVRPTTTHSGVTHVRTYQSGQYVVVGNHLAQHRELSLTAIGLGAHILSLPEGAPVDIRSLADRFPEGRDRIAFALRELEAHGYLERVRERTEAGRLFTRTYAHHTPQEDDRGGTGSVAPHAQATSVPADPDPGPGIESDPEPVPPAVPERRPEAAGDRPAAPVPSAVESYPAARHEKAAALLAALRRTDDRLTLSPRDVNRLAPAVTAWFDRGVPAAVVHRVLTADLPVDVRRPAGVLDYRLRELLPAPLPAIPAPCAVPADLQVGRRDTHPFQTCDGCERAFRAPAPGRCRDCRHRQASPAVACAA